MTTNDSLCSSTFYVHFMCPGDIFGLHATQHKVNDHFKTHTHIYRERTIWGRVARLHAQCPKAREKIDQRKWAIKIQWNEPFDLLPAPQSMRNDKIIVTLHMHQLYASNATKTISSHFTQRRKISFRELSSLIDFALVHNWNRLRRESFMIFGGRHHSPPHSCDTLTIPKITIAFRSNRTHSPQIQSQYSIQYSKLIQWLDWRYLFMWSPMAKCCAVFVLLFSSAFIVIWWNEERTVKKYRRVVWVRAGECIDFNRIIDVLIPFLHFYFDALFCRHNRCAANWKDFIENKNKKYLYIPPPAADAVTVVTTDNAFIRPHPHPFSIQNQTNTRPNLPNFVYFFLVNAIQCHIASGYVTRTIPINFERLPFRRIKVETK